MWETISQAEIEDAKALLSRKRAEALSRQASEIRSLDAQLEDIKSFDRLVAAFFEEYMGQAAPSTPAVSAPLENCLSEQSKLPPQAHQIAPAQVLQIRQNILPKFIHRKSTGR